MSRLAAPAFLISLVIPSLSGAAPKDERISVSYDVANLLYRPGGKSGFDSVDEIVKQIVNSVNPPSWVNQPEGGNRIFEVNGTKLEILAYKKEHDELKQVLDSLRILCDLAIDVKCTFFSVDAKLFDKEIRPLLGKAKNPTDEEDDETAKEWQAAMLKFKKNAEKVQSGSVRLGNQRTASIASLRHAHAFASGKVDENGAPVWEVEFTGISYRCKASVSPDRRFVALKIDQSLREPEAPRQGDVGPRIKERKATIEATVADGSSHMIVVPYTPKTVAERGKILVLVIEPLLHIEAEEKERRGKKDDG